MVRDNKRADILLSTYNGAKYLEEQLASIAAQEYADWHLIVRDDGSSDDTPNITEQFKKDNPGKVTILEGGTNIGVVSSYALLMSESDADYIFFCDQDDYWLKDKLKRQVEKLDEAEGEPALCICGLDVTDRTMSRSFGNFYELSGFDPENIKINSLIIQNIAPGCCMGINKALKEIAEPVSSKAVMHDWWLMLAAFEFGKIIYMPDELMRYRRHESTVTQVNQGYKGLFARLSGYRHQIRRLSEQAASFHSRFSGRLKANDSDLIKDFGNIYSFGFLTRRLILYKYGIKKNNKLKTVITFFLV